MTIFTKKIGPDHPEYIQGKGEFTQVQVLVQGKSSDGKDDFLLSHFTGHMAKIEAAKQKSMLEKKSPAQLDIYMRAVLMSEYELDQDAW